MTSEATRRRDEEHAAVVRPARSGGPRQVIEIEDVERISDEHVDPPVSWKRRAWRAAAPTLLGMLIDGSDFVAGMNVPMFPVGCLLGFLWSGYLDVPPTWRIVITILTGVYLFLPFTHFVPAATVMGLAVQIFRPPVLKREPFAG